MVNNTLGVILWFDVIYWLGFFMLTKWEYLSMKVTDTVPTTQAIGGGTKPPPKEQSVEFAQVLEQEQDVQLKAIGGGTKPPPAQNEM